MSRKLLQIPSAGLALAGLALALAGCAKKEDSVTPTPVPLSSTARASVYAVVHAFTAE